MIDFLGNNLKELPYFRALLRAFESRFYQELDIDGNTLDLGCGDGLFARSTLQHKLLVGIDPSVKALIEAKASNAYSIILGANGGDLPFSSQQFDCIISNSVLEHIRNIDLVIKEISRLLKAGGKLIFCVPNIKFTKNLSIALWFEQRNFCFIANQYRIFFNKISRHHHCDDVETWRKRLEKVGISIIKNWDYFSPDALKILEWGHMLGLGNLVQKIIFGRWVIFTNSPGKMLAERLCRPIYENESTHQAGAYTFFVCEKNNIENHG